MVPIRRLLALTACAGLLLAVATGPGSADDKKEGKKEGVNVAGKDLKKFTEDKKSQAANDLGLAGQLIRYGRQHKSPEALLTAARILGTTATAERKEQPKTEVAKDKKGEERKGAAPDNSPKALLAEAKKMARNDKTIVAMADRVGQALDEGIRGAASGPLRSLHRIPAYGTHSYRITFRGGETARVVLDGDGGTDLDLFIYDENGNLVRSDVGLSDYANLSWVPRWTGPFTIRVRNLGRFSNGYFLTNN
ncbi:MAG: hypothetical protein IT429_11500 [Gemmataceae bacterium]|nr:hypothetical protein [Gemmataceae bacterium]